jgi:hypothetical protein
VDQRGVQSFSPVLSTVSVSPVIAAPTLKRIFIGVPLRPADRLLIKPILFGLVRPRLTEAVMKQPIDGREEGRGEIKPAVVRR